MNGRIPVLVFVLALAGCDSPPPPSAEPTEPELHAVASLAPPARDDILAYLNGKRLPLPDGDHPLRFERGQAFAPNQRTIALEPTKVTRLELKPSPPKGNVDHVDCEIRFLYTDGSSIHAVVGWLRYRTVDGRIAFFGLDVTEVARQ